jgi:uncharacterized small protein (DUF1192 family)
VANADEDPWGAPPKRKPDHQMGEPLDRLSIGELDERIEALRQEIARLEAQRAAKNASRAGADAFFKR